MTLSVSEGTKPNPRLTLSWYGVADDRIHQLENEVARLHESLLILREDTLRLSQQSSPALKVSHRPAQTCLSTRSVG